MALSTADMIQALLGVKTFQRTNPVTATVGVAAELIARGSPQRAFLLVINLSANTIYIAPDNQAAVTRGIRLAPNGGSASLIWDRDLELVTQPWFGIATGAGSALYVLESIIGG